MWKSGNGMATRAPSELTKWQISHMAKTTFLGKMCSFHGLQQFCVNSCVTILSNISFTESLFWILMLLWWSIIMGWIISTPMFYTFQKLFGKNWEMAVLVPLVFSKKPRAWRCIVKTLNLKLWTLPLILHFVCHRYMHQNRSISLVLTLFYHIHFHHLAGLACYPQPISCHTGYPDASIRNTLKFEKYTVPLVIDVICSLTCSFSLSNWCLRLINLSIWNATFPSLLFIV